MLELGFSYNTSNEGWTERGWEVAFELPQFDWGIAGDAKAVKRTIEFQMLDTMRFVPDRIEVRLVHRNAGKVMHEFVIGTK